MINCIIVGAGGFIGSVCRYLIGMIPYRELSERDKISNWSRLLLETITCFSSSSASYVTGEDDEVMKNSVIIVEK